MREIKLSRSEWNKRGLRFTLDHVLDPKPKDIIKVNASLALLFDQFLFSVAVFRATLLLCYLTGSGSEQTKVSPNLMDTNLLWPYVLRN